MRRTLRHWWSPNPQATRTRFMGRQKRNAIWISRWPTAIPSHMRTSPTTRWTVGVTVHSFKRTIC
jgi:hypothetical protein